jgi:hypothetical protein
MKVPNRPSREYSGCILRASRLKFGRSCYNGAIAGLFFTVSIPGTAPEENIITMIWQIVSWYFLLLLLGWLTFPLAYRLFRGLPDRAYSLSRVLGLLLWGFVFWFLASLNILQNNPGSILFGLALLIGASIWAGWGRWQ